MIITDEQIKALNISSKQKVEWVDICLRHKKEYDLPPKISIKKENGVFYNTMPAIMEPLDVAGVKLVNRYVDRVPALDAKILLYKYSTGLMDAILDGNEITAMRTGAVAVHSAMLIARKDFSTVSMIGLGNIMRHTADIFFDIFSDRKLVVKLYNFMGEGESFVQRYKDIKNVEFILCDNYVDTFSDSDLIFSAVSYMDGDFCDEKTYKKGCTIIPIHTRGFMGCDLTFDKVFGDDTGHLHEFKYFDKYKSFAEIAEVLSGEKKGRESDDERILVYNIGLAIHDLYYSKRITELLNEKK